MNRVEAIMRLERLKWLIEHKTTGTPKELAAKLEVSERTLFRLINELSTVTGCTIRYSYMHSGYIFGSGDTKKLTWS